MKHLAATHVVREIKADVYGPTTLSNALAEPNFRDGLIYT